MADDDDDDRNDKFIISMVTEMCNKVSKFITSFNFFIILQKKTIPKLKEKKNVVKKPAH